MNQKRSPFRKRNTPAQPEEPRPKPATELTDSELEEALRKARREILDAQHEELRLREKARREILDAQHEELRLREKARLVPGDAGTKPRNLSGIFSKNKRRFK